MDLHYRLPLALAEEHIERATEDLRTYTHNYHGASFESLGINDPYRITSDDLVAVSMLSVFVPPGPH